MKTEITLNREQIKDVKNIARRVYAPLKGFLKKDDFEEVVSNMRLCSGEIFPIPVTLDVSSRNYSKEVLLKNEKGKEIAKLKNTEVFEYDKNFFVSFVFGAKETEHPGVAEVYNMKEFLIGGEIELVDFTEDYFPEYNYTPKETREIFKKKDWKKIVAFQTRNVPHRGHEFLQKQALKDVDGIFVQPVIGKKKESDFKDEYILISYEILLKKYFPPGKTFLGILPLKMRYAGPREAVFHALIRRNFGCTHFIVGRDHAGVGDYYAPYEAQELLEKVKSEIGIEIMSFPEVVYCKKRNKHIFKGEAPSEETIKFSGTKLRKWIKDKETPPEYIIRPEIYSFLSQSENALVDEDYNKKGNGRGFVLWFTGFSQSGKTTTADAVHKKLKEDGIKAERLDGDIVRQSISKDLGFSKSDRDENIKRIGMVSSLLSKNGIGVITSFISPYKKGRDEVREKCNNFVEIYCDASLETCESRDARGLYKKARKGEIDNFTGISAPYENPENPEIVLDTSGDFVERNANIVVDYLQEKGLV